MNRSPLVNISTRGVSLPRTARKESETGYKREGILFVFVNYIFL